LPAGVDLEKETVITGRVVDGSGQVTRLLTIEVGNRERQVVQARRRFNEWPGQKELSFLSRWTSAGGPTIAKWVMG